MKAFYPPAFWEKEEEEEEGKNADTQEDFKDISGLRKAKSQSGLQYNARCITGQVDMIKSNKSE
jgi:hypothetical protein